MQLDPASMRTRGLGRTGTLLAVASQGSGPDLLPPNTVWKLTRPYVAICSAQTVDLLDHKAVEMINRWQPGCCVTLVPISADAFDFEIRTWTKPARTAHFPTFSTLDHCNAIIEEHKFKYGGKNIRSIALSSPRRCLRPRNSEPRTL